MRCQICNKDGARAYNPPEYLCGDCIDTINRSSGEVFTLADLYAILIPEDSDDSVAKIVRGK